MTAIDVFLVGALATGSTSRNSAPMLLLVVSGLGFLYGTLIYANSAVTMAKGTDDFNRQMDRGNVVSETLGVCGLALAVPLAVTAVTSNAFLAWSALVISGIGFVAYQLSPYSLLRNYFTCCGAGALAAGLVVLDLFSFLALRSHESTTSRSWSGATVGVLLAATILGVFLPNRSTVQSPVQGASGLASELEHLKQLHREEALTDDEFAAAKTKVLRS